MLWRMTGDAELEALAAATKRYKRADKALNAARDEAIAAVVAALKAGARPTDVDTASPFTPAYNRRKAREHGISPKTRRAE